MKKVEGSPIYRKTVPSDTPGRFNLEFYFFLWMGHNIPRVEDIPDIGNILNIPDSNNPDIGNIPDK